MDEMPKFREEVINVDSLSYDQSEIKWGLEPSAQEYQATQRPRWPPRT